MCGPLSLSSSWSSLASSPGSTLIVVLGTVITLTAMFTSSLSRLDATV